jgi:hypothetical protein
LKYEISIEDLVPRRREFTVDVPDDEDDPAEYLRAHPELWQDLHVPPQSQSIAGLRFAPVPEALADGTMIAVEWDLAIVLHQRALTTVGELSRELEAATGRKPEPFGDPVELSWYVRGNAREKLLDSWLNLLHAQGRVHTTSTIEVEDPLITGARLAIDAERDEQPAHKPAVPGRRDTTVTYTFTETSHGQGRVNLAELIEAGVWQPGTPITGAVLNDFFGEYGEDLGEIAHTGHAYSQITLAGDTDDGSAQ